MPNFGALLNDLVWVFGKKSLLCKQPVLSFFFNSKSLERPGLIIESLEYLLFTKVDKSFVKHSEWITDDQKPTESEQYSCFICNQRHAGF